MTKSVYQIGFDVGSYQYLYVESHDLSAVALNGTRRADSWRPPPVRAAEPARPTPHLWYLSGCSGVVLSSRARTVLEPILTGGGEFLPLPHDDMELWVFNVTAVSDCVDRERSDWLVLGEVPRTLEFYPSRLPSTALFKVPETADVWIYGLENTDDFARSIRLTVEAEILTGLTFEEIWNSDEGGKRISAVP